MKEKIWILLLMLIVKLYALGMNMAEGCVAKKMKDTA